MPDWVAALLTFILLVCVVLVCWTMYEATRNYWAVRHIEDLNDFARNAFFKVLTLFLSTGSLAAIGVLSMLTPRPTWARVATTILTIVLAMALAGSAVHEWLGMRKALNERI